jgi:hypothetical protein
MITNLSGKLALAVTPLSFWVRGHRTNREGTGFLFDNGSRRFLVTARHLVLDPYETGDLPTEIHLRVKLEKDNFSKAEDRTIVLAGAQGVRPRILTSEPIDVTAIELPEAVLRDAWVTGFTADDLPPDDLILDAGEDVLVAGYPEGHYDETNNLPLLRRGSLASFYRFKFKGRSYFEVDANLHRGTSGAPVVLRPTSIIHRVSQPFALLSGNVSALLGIHSQSVDDNLAVQVVWYSTVLKLLTDSAAADLPTA